MVVHACFAGARQVFFYEWCCHVCYFLLSQPKRYHPPMLLVEYVDAHVEKILHGCCLCVIGYQACNGGAINNMQQLSMRVTWARAGSSIPPESSGPRLLALSFQIISVST